MLGGDEWIFYVRMGIDTLITSSTYHFTIDQIKEIPSNNHSEKISGKMIVCFFSKSKERTHKTGRMCKSPTSFGKEIGFQSVKGRKGIPPFSVKKFQLTFRENLVC